MKERIRVRAPSNIALIKYMGKKTGENEAGLNLPENESLSMTLSGLCTELEMARSQSVEDEILDAPGITEAGRVKFLNHVTRFREQASMLSQASGVKFLDLAQKVSIRSQNTFPHSAGIASSASSFAALTLACFYFYAQDRDAFRRRFENDQTLRETMARFSRLGSGSSCRSFFGPFCSWQGEKVLPQPSHLPELTDLVLIVSEQAKEVGSSEAHARVKTSIEWRGRPGHPTRPERAHARFHQMTRALNEGSFSLVSTLTYDDFTDMHELFHTSHPPFTYMTNESKEVLSALEGLALQNLEMMVTMDAGPNIHVLVPTERAEAMEKKIRVKFPELKILKDVASSGPVILEG